MLLRNEASSAKQESQGYRPGSSRSLGWPLKGPGDPKRGTLRMK